MRATVTAPRALKLVISLLGPVLLAVFPLLSLFAQNQTDLEVSVLWWPLLGCLVGAVVVQGVFLALTRDVAKSGVLASLVVFAFCYYGVLTDRGPGLFLALWLVLTVLVLAVVLRTRLNFWPVAIVIALGAAAMAVPQVVTLSVYHARNPAPTATDPRLWPTPLEAPVVPAGTKLPDIYVIVPDDYARSDVLAQYFQYDNGEFIHQLESRGFVISEQDRSPYSDSESNIASLVNMDYLDAFATVLGATSEDVRAVQRVIEDNRAARLLAPLGYDYVHLDTDEVTFSGGNPDISPFAPPDSFSSLWLQQTVLRTIGGPLGFDQEARDDRFRTAIRSEFSRLVSVPESGTPKFVVFHTLLPHDPYLYDSQGRPVTFPGRTEEDLASTVGRTYYLQQLEYVNRLLLDSVDRILERASTPPVILVQSDEGFQANSEPFGEAAMQDIRVKGLSAFYLPGHSGAGVPDPPNSVNDLRFVFNEYLGTDYPMLDTVSYPEGDYPYQFEPMKVR
jgi:hypothetical protein